MYKHNFRKKIEFESRENMDLNSENEMDEHLGVDWYEDSFLHHFDRETSDEILAGTLSRLFYEGANEPYYQEEANIIQNDIVGNALDTLNDDVLRTIADYLDLDSLRNLVEITNQSFLPFALRTFRFKFRSIIRLNRYHIETGRYIGIMSIFGSIAEGLYIDNDEPSPQVLMTSAQCVECYTRIFTAIPKHTLKTLIIEDRRIGSFVKIFLSRTEVYKDVKLLILNTILENTQSINLDRFPMIEDLNLVGNPSIECIARKEHLKALTMKPSGENILILLLSCTLDLHSCEPTLTYLDIESGPPIGLNKMIGVLWGIYRVHQTLKTFRFSGHMSNSPNDPVVQEITDKIMNYTQLTKLDLRLYRNATNTNYLCTSANVEKLIKLKSLQYITLVEPMERPSEGMILRLFESLPDINDVVAIRIVGEQERQRIKAMHPTYRRVDKYSSTIR